MPDSVSKSSQKIAHEIRKLQDEIQQLKRSLERVDERLEEAAEEISEDTGPGERHRATPDSEGLPSANQH